MHINFGKVVSKKHTLIIYDLIGETIYREDIENDSEAEINTQKWKSGVYVLSVLDQNLESVYHSKFVIE